MKKNICIMYRLYSLQLVFLLVTLLVYYPIHAVAPSSPPGRGNIHSNHRQELEHEHNLNYRQQLHHVREQSTRQLKCSYKPKAVLFFYHIAKTGGTTFSAVAKANGFHFFELSLCEKCHGFQWVHTERYLNHSFHLLQDSAIKCQWRKIDQRKLYVEMHPYAIRPFVDRLDKLVKTLRKESIPTVSVTMLRDPIDHAISLYNYLPRKHTHSAKNMMSTMAFNLQCNQVLHGYNYSYSNANESQCIFILMRYFDWVGVTSRINETLKFVEGALNVPFSCGLIPPHKNAGDKITYPAQYPSAVTRKELEAIHPKEELIKTRYSIDWALYSHFYNVTLRDNVTP